MTNGEVAIDINKKNKYVCQIKNTDRNIMTTHVNIDIAWIRLSIKFEMPNTKWQGCC